MIRLVQWLCPKRHCSLAMAYDPQEETCEQVMEHVKEFAAKLGVLAECYICGSRE